MSHFWYQNFHQVGPKNLEVSQAHQFADELFDKPGDIDIHFGAHLFYEMLRWGWMARPGNYQVLQGTVLGWTLSGRTPTDTIQHDPKPTFLLREDNSLVHILNRFIEVETVRPATMDIEEQIC